MVAWIGGLTGAAIIAYALMQPDMSQLAGTTGDTVQTTETQSDGQTDDEEASTGEAASENDTASDSDDSATDDSSANTGTADSGNTETPASTDTEKAATDETDTGTDDAPADDDTIETAAIDQDTGQADQADTPAEGTDTGDDAAPADDSTESDATPADQATDSTQGDQPSAGADDSATDDSTDTNSQDTGSQDTADDTAPGDQSDTQDQTDEASGAQTETADQSDAATGTTQGDASQTAATDEPEAEPTVLQTGNATENPPNVEAPVFDLIRIDQQGEAVLAGRAEPNANVEILSNGEVIGSAQASSSGEFVALVTTEVSAAPKALELVATQDDGSVARSTEPVIVLGRLEEPEAPAATQTDATDDAASPAIVAARGDDVVLVQPSRVLATDQVTLDTITYTIDSAVLLVGRGSAGREVRVYANGDIQGRTDISGDGSWSLSVDDLAAGIYMLRVDQIGADGKVASRFETPFKREFPEAGAIERLQNASEIIVQPGNNLWTIALNRYGEGFKYTVIFDANKDQIRDPDLIYPGQVFDLPQQ